MIRKSCVLFLLVTALGAGWMLAILSEGNPLWIWGGAAVVVAGWLARSSWRDRSKKKDGGDTDVDFDALDEIALLKKSLPILSSSDEPSSVSLRPEITTVVIDAHKITTGFIDAHKITANSMDWSSS